MSNYRSLLLRSNRVLGASLVEHSLVNIEHLEAANERLFEILQNGLSPQSSLLGVLLGEMGSVNESDLMDFAVKEYGLGLIDLADHVIADDCRKLIEPDLTWATWTLPFDFEDGFYFVATSYYLSIAAREFWEDRLDAPIVWYATSMESISSAIERIAEEAKQA